MLRELLEAARGGRHDYTTGSIGKAIFLLAVPMVLEMMMESLFAVADTFWVGRLGANAVATIGLTETMMIIIYTVAMGLGIAASAIIARRIGEHDRDGASTSAVQALVLATVFSVILAALGAFFAADLLRLMGAAPDVIATGTNFTRVMLGGSTTVFLLFMINACFRGAGDAAIAMRVLIFANTLNMILGPLFIFGIGPFPKLGVTGAAVATTIGRGLGVVFALSRLVKGHGALEIRRRHLVLDTGTMQRMLTLAGNGTFQVLVGSLNWIGLVRLMSSFGSTAMAGYTIAIRLVIFALLPAWGLSNAAATLVGQSLGAGNPERAEQSVWTAARYNLVFLGGMGLLFIAIAPWIVSAFTTDAEVARVATFGLRTIAAGFPFFAFGMVFTQAFNGAGDTVTPTWINIGVFWLFEVPLAWVLAEHTPLGLNGIFVSVLAAYSLLAAVSALLFRRGKWKMRRV